MLAWSVHGRGSAVRAEVSAARRGQDGNAVHSQPIDHAHLARYTLGDRALEIEILNLFAGQAPSTLAAIAEAGDATAWRNATHTLKGSARAVGAVRVASVATAAELLAGAAAGERAAAVTALSEALDEVLGYIAVLTSAIASADAAAA